jgi:hypothetical protein
MADQVQSSINIDTSKAQQTLNDLRASYDSLSASVDKTTTSFTNFNTGTQATIDQLQKIQQQADATATSFANLSTQLTSGAESASNAAGAVANSSGVVRDAVVQNTGVVTASLGQQKVAFTDLARIVDGQGLSLRNLTSTLGQLGPEFFLAGAAVAGLGYALYSLIDTSKAVKEALKEVNDELDKLQNRDKTINADIEAQTKLLKSRAEAAGATVEAITAVEVDGAKQELSIATQTLAEIDSKRKAAIKVMLKDETDKNKAIVDDLDLAYSKQLKIIDLANNKIEEITNTGIVKENEKEKQAEARRQSALAAQLAFVNKVNQINETAEQKETDQLTAEYQIRKENLIKNQLDTSTLTAAYEQGLTNIRIKFEQERQKELTKLYAEQAKVTAEERKKELTELTAIEKQFEQETEKDLMTEESKKLLDLKKSYDKAIDLAMLNGEDTVKIEQKYNDAVNAVKTKQRLADAKQAIADQKILTQQLQKELQIVKNDQTLTFKAKQQAYKDEQTLTDEAFDAGLISQQEYLDTTEKNEKAQQELVKATVKEYADAATNIGSALTSIGQALGEQTQVGKDVAIAGAIINTISSAIKAFNSLADIPYVGTILGAAAAAAALASGYANIKKIEAVQVPGAAGGGSSSSSSPGVAGGGAAPTYNTPQIASTARVTNISGSSVNALGNAVNQNQKPVRAYVVESDITSSQNQVAGYQASSKI